MNRRTFIIETSALTIAASCKPVKHLSERTPAPLARIGLGTVMFRYRFRQTKPIEIVRPSPMLTLLDIPKYYRERFNISTIEFWSEHFDTLDLSYLNELKCEIKRNRSTLLNIQVDRPYNLASTNEDERQKSLSLVKDWIDAAAYLGSECIRINPGRVGGALFQSIKSLKTVNAYAKQKGLKLLTENHFGIEMDPDKHVRLLTEVGDNCYSLPDFGNYPIDQMFGALAKILPYAYMISAKVKNFDTNMRHVSFDYGKCVKLAEQYGFKGVYCLEQWSEKFQDVDFEKLTDWLIAETRRFIKE